MKYHQKCDQNPLCVSSVLHNGVSSVVDQDYIVRSLVKTYVKKGYYLVCFVHILSTEKFQEVLFKTLRKLS